jgi:predicted small lipoprotein YifL
MIQKILALLMMLTMLLGMTACGTDGSREQVPEAGPDAQTEPAGQAEGLSAEELEQILSGPETELTLSLLNEGTTESSL